VTNVPVHRVDVDVAIVGSGFAGAMLALILRQHGRRVALIDRATHPRFAIGESSTPLANLLIEEIADRHDLPRLGPLSKWGTWQATYPDVMRGRKRGFSFFQHSAGEPFVDDDTHARQLLVAASPNAAIADTHWYRPHLDAWLTREAEDAGVVVLEGTVLGTPEMTPAGAVLEGTRRAASVRIDAGFIVDASGPRGYLWRTLGLGDAPLAWLPPTQALYCHFDDVALWRDVSPSEATPPYPVDEAALHHVLPGAWMWVLRFDDGCVSAGLAATDAFAADYGFSNGPDAWRRVLRDFPSLETQFATARTRMPFIHAPRIAHRTAVVTGPTFALLPSAAGVIDPLLSTGFPLTLLGISRLADVLLGHEGDSRGRALDQYARDTVAELSATERLVGAMYASMHDFTLFKRLGLLYFAAASFAETVRRLGAPEGARGFLLQADPVFGPALRSLTSRAACRPTGAARTALLQDVATAIAPFDVAGLGDDSRRDWYPVRAADLHAARERLGVSAAAIDALLERCGFSEPPIAAAGAHA